MTEIKVEDLTNLGLVIKDSQYLVNILKLKGFA